MERTEAQVSAEIRASLADLIGERIYEGWRFVGANIIPSDHNEFFNFPDIQLDITLSHDEYVGLGELDELEMVRGVIGALISGYPLEEAQERRNEIEEELEEGYVRDGLTPRYNLKDMPYVINSTRYDY